MSTSYAPTPRTTATRDRGRMTYDRAAAHAVLDQAYDCSVAFVVDDEPRVLPTLHVRVGDVLYLHGSTGAAFTLRARTDGVAVCVAVTLLDALVYGRSQMHHSANYRSVVAHGTARLVTDEAERRTAMTALVDKAAPGRAADSRPPDPRELAATAVLALPLREVSVRARTGGVVDDPADLDLPHWAGVLPLRRVAGPPEPDPQVTVAPPAYLGGPSSPWCAAPPLSGERVVLEPLRPGHVEDLLAGVGGSPEHRVAGARAVAAAGRRQWHGTGATWLVRTAEGAAWGLAGYVDVDADARALRVEVSPAAEVVHAGAGRIGTGQIGTGRVGTGQIGTGAGHGPEEGAGATDHEQVRAGAVRLLLERAFDVLGAERVCLHVDADDLDARRAVQRWGVTAEGVLRRHRRRPDGGWGDTAVLSTTAPEWPSVAARLHRMVTAGRPTAE